jgi:hypothetical protein
MPFLDVMHTYFRGEKLEALAFILPAGLLLVVFGVLFLKAERMAFTWGAALPAIAFGIVLIATGISVGARTAGQVAEVTRAFEESPATMVRAELPRMNKVNENFRTMFVAFGVAVALGLVLVYAIRVDWAQGIGAMLILIGGLGLVIDGVASRRAVPYTAALEAIAAEQSVPSE